MQNDLLTELTELERSLHDYEVRKQTSQLVKLLHPELIEIGYSGNTFDFKSTLRDVPNEAKPNFSVYSKDYQIHPINETLVQLFYQEARESKDGSLSRHAKRCSIWQKTDAGWQMRYHQATPVSPFEKS